MKRPKGFSDQPVPVPRSKSARNPPVGAPAPKLSSESALQSNEQPQAVITPIHSDFIDTQSFEDLGQNESRSEVSHIDETRSRELVSQKYNDKQILRSAKKRVRAAERNRKRREKHEQRRFSAHARKRKRKILVAVSAVGGLALFVGAGVFTPIMAVQNIEVTGVSRVPTEELVASLMPLKGTPLALVKDQDIHSALEEFPLIQQYSIQKVPPNDLHVTVQERQPVIAVERGEEMLLVDPAGVVIETLPSDARPAEVPIGVGIGSDLTSDRFRAAAQVVKSIPAETRSSIEFIAAPTPQSITMTMATGVEVMWGDMTNSNRKLIVLQSMLTALGETPVTYIDVSSPGAPVFRSS